ncbi:MAG: HD domain-containing protein [Thermoleophilia bacterium]|nr:HD domain-containing protein [Thermoleophilia bacterium]
MASQLTVSAGIVDLGHAQDPKEMLRFAELALRQAKSTGHDAVAVYLPGRVADGQAGERFGHLQTLSALRALARAVDMRDENTQRHSERVAALTHRLAVEMGWPPRRAGHLQEAALVHDVGKVGVPDAVLLKAGPLTEEERLIIETHPSLGARIVSEILDAEQVAWVRGHHERVDGQGYPDGLSGDDLSQGARIMAVADTWDAMTSDRPYRKALSSERALEIAIDVAGSQLDADVVAALVRLHRAGVPETQGHNQVSGFHTGAGGTASDDEAGIP